MAMVYNRKKKANNPSLIFLLHDYTFYVWDSLRYRYTWVRQIWLSLCCIPSIQIMFIDKLSF